MNFACNNFNIEGEVEARVFLRLQPKYWLTPKNIFYYFIFTIDKKIFCFSDYYCKVMNK